MQIVSMTANAFDSFQLEFSPESQSFLALALFGIMLSVAMNLKPEHFRAVAQQPKVFLTGFLSQIIGLPLVTFLLCLVLNPAPSLALGMIIVACCPGGNVSNLFSMMGGGNSALSVALTASSSLFAAFLAPVTILFWTSLYGPTAELLETINLDVAKFLIQTFVLLAVPLAVGMVFRHFFPNIAEKIYRPLSVAAFLLLVTLIAIGAAKQWEDFLALGVMVIGLAILHNAAAFLFGYLAARFARADIPSRRAITIEVGIQNSGLAIIILLTQLAGFGGAAAIIVIWGTWHIIAGLTLVAIFKRQDRRRAYV